jgi:hypothetical protein
MNTRTYFEHVAGQPELDVVPWQEEEPGEITVEERALTPEEFEAIRRQIEARAA